MPHQSEIAFGFLDPQVVVRGCHLIPAFSHGRTTEYLPKSIARPEAASDQDWRFYYVNMLSIETCLCDTTKRQRQRQLADLRHNLFGRHPGRLLYSRYRPDPAPICKPNRLPLFRPLNRDIKTGPQTLKNASRSPSTTASELAATFSALGLTMAVVTVTVTHHPHSPAASDEHCRIRPRAGPFSRLDTPLTVGVVCASTDRIATAKPSLCYWLLPSPVVFCLNESSTTTSISSATAGWAQSTANFATNDILNTSTLKAAGP
ncbi:hypothetical protein MIND_01147400 [Mycena indigotica]|uniref:Uncharacterized protein n=1 Tax=Mycena indigotica TaxID=2126181 RepID=A0A8H6S6A5_9AGAR|nr:uncharacterized protein MIND_01147400 [Mycena indigotica]KAF7293674.1 hypothetical protein MIND_01147400 [Mycena indigotica]